ncbi:MAG: hypothetical protein ACI33P_13020 [Lysinibacillus sp.]
MKKRIGFLFFIVCLLTALHVGPNEAYAKAELEVEADIGLNNKIKQDKGAPLHVTITNHGDDFSGDFVIDAEVSYNIGSALVYPLDLASGETKTFDIFLEGYSEDMLYSNTRKDYFHFYEGGIEKGERIGYKGDHYVTPSILEYDAKFIYVVTSNEDRLAGVKKISQFSAMPVQPYFINQTDGMELPEEASALEMVDVILFDEVAISDLTDEQQQALYSWVQQGGTVLLGDSDLGDAAAGIFAKQLPLALSEGRQVLTKDNLEKLTGNGVFSADIQVKEASLKQGSAIISSVENKIVAASTEIGQGKLIQTTFSLGDEPLASMGGYAKLLSTILSLETTSSTSIYNPSFGWGNDWTYYNELFPSFKFSSGWIITLIIVYILLIGPVLYFVLKRFDRREKMWLYIPMIAIVCSLAFFIFGAKDRIIKPQIQQMAMFDIQNDGTLLGSYTNALLTNKGGDFVFETDANTSAIAVMSNDLVNQSGNLHKNSYIEKTATGTELTLNDLNYWSVQSFIGKTTISEAGKLEMELEFEQGKLTGTVKNTLPVDLKDVTVLTGTQEIVLGDLEAGGTLDVSEDTGSQTLVSARSSSSNYYYYGQAITGDLLEKQLEMLQTTAIDKTAHTKQPIITAWTDSSLVPVTYKGNANMSTISYFVQPFTPDIVLKGDVLLTNNDFTSEIEPIDMNDYSHMDYEKPNHAVIGEGEHRLSFQLASNTELSEITWQELEMTYDSNLMTVEILNQKTGEYEPLGDSPAALTSNLSDYMLEDETITFKVTRVGIDNGESIKLPAIKLKGVAK